MLKVAQHITSFFLVRDVQPLTIRLEINWLLNLSFFLFFFSFTGFLRFQLQHIFWTTSKNPNIEN